MSRRIFRVELYYQGKRFQRLVIVGAQLIEGAKIGISGPVAWTDVDGLQLGSFGVSWASGFRIRRCEVGICRDIQRIYRNGLLNFRNGLVELPGGTAEPP